MGCAQPRGNVIGEPTENMFRNARISISLVTQYLLEHRVNSDGRVGDSWVYQSLSGQWLFEIN